MTIAFRNADSRFPFLWEAADQPGGRWHATGEGPAQYLADTPDGAWAEFLRHEEITEPADLDGVARSLWAIDVDELELLRAATVDLPAGFESVDSYPACQDRARQRRAAGAAVITAPSAALVPGGARGEYTDGRLVPGSDRDGVVWVLFGRRRDLRGWRVVEAGRPPGRVLSLVRPLS
jgi:hypothetical protein